MRRLSRCFAPFRYPRSLSPIFDNPDLAIPPAFVSAAAGAAKKCRSNRMSRQSSNQVHIHVAPIVFLQAMLYEPARRSYSVRFRVDERSWSDLPLRDSPPCLLTSCECKAVYNCAANLSLSFFVCDKAADHTFWTADNAGVITWWLDRSGECGHLLLGSARWGKVV